MFVSLTLLSLSFGQSGDKLKVILDSHSASIAAIRTLSYGFSFSDPVRGRANGLYRRSGKDFILKVSYADGGTSTTSSVSGRSQALFKKVGRGAQQYSLDGLIEADAGDLATECDPTHYDQLLFYGQMKYRCELSEILAQKCTCRYVGSVERSGRSLERVEVSHVRADLTIDFDPAVNYLARVVVARSKLAGGTGKPSPEQEVTEFREIAPGIYYPVKARLIDPATGKEGWVIEFTNVKVNEPIAPETLSFKFPPGVLVMDKTRSGMFVTDSAGEPTLPAKDKNGRLIQMATGADPAVTPDDPEMPPRPSQSEAKSLTRWVLPAAVVLLGIGVTLLLVRRIRRGRTG